MPSVLDTAGVNANKFFINQSDAGREQVVSITKSGGLKHSELLDIYRALTQPVGPVTRDAVTGNVRTGPDAFTFAGFGTAAGIDFVAKVESGSQPEGETPTETVFVRVQGTGTFTPGANFAGTGATTAVVATFAPRF